MGDMADYYRNDEFMEEFTDTSTFAGVYYKEVLPKYLKGKLKWETKEGDDVIVQDITTSHINNTIKFLRRKTKTVAIQAWVDVFEIEIYKRNKDDTKDL